MAAIDPKRQITSAGYLMTTITLFPNEHSRLSEIVRILSSVGISTIWIDTAYVYEGAWSVRFPHHGDPVKDPIQALREILGPFQNEA